MKTSIQYIPWGESRLRDIPKGAKVYQLTEPDTGNGCKITNGDTLTSGKFRNYIYYIGKNSDKYTSAFRVTYTDDKQLYDAIVVGFIKLSETEEKACTTSHPIA